MHPADDDDGDGGKLTRAAPPPSQLRYSPYGGIAQVIFAHPNAMRVHQTQAVDTDTGKCDPSGNVLHVSLREHASAAIASALRRIGAQHRHQKGAVAEAKLRVCVTVTHLTQEPPEGEFRRVFPDVVVPASVLLDALPCSTTFGVYVCLSSVVCDGRVVAQFPVHTGRLMWTFSTGSMEDRAERYLQVGRTALFLSLAAAAEHNSVAAAAAAKTTPPPQTLWLNLRRAAIMLSMPRAWRLFMLCFVNTGLYPWMELPDESSTLRANTLGVVADHDLPTESMEFTLPQEHAVMLLATPKPHVVLSGERDSTDVLVEEFDRLLAFQSPPLLTVSIMHDHMDRPLIGNGVTVDRVFHCARTLIDRLFVDIDGTKWFLSTRDEVRTADMRALGCAICGLLAMTGMGPGVDFALPVLHAIRGTSPPMPADDDWIPPRVRVFLDFVRDETASTGCAACMSGKGWCVGLPGQTVSDGNRSAVGRAVRERLWNDTIADTTLAITLRYAFDSALGPYALVGVPVPELAALMRGPPMRLDVWRARTGVLFDEAVSPESVDSRFVLDAFFGMMKTLPAADLARVARFWTGRECLPVQEEDRFSAVGNAHACTICVRLDTPQRIVAAHTCAAQLDVDLCYLPDPTLLREKLFFAIESCMDAVTGELTFAGE